MKNDNRSLPKLFMLALVICGASVAANAQTGYPAQLQIARSLERIPEGKDWVAEHRTSLERIRLPTPRTDQEKKDELALVDQFKKLGVELQHRSG